MRTPLPLLFGLLTHALFAQDTYEVLVSSRSTHAVYRYTADGTWLGEFVTSGAGGLFGTEDILLHPDGSVLVTGFGNGSIKRYDGITGGYLGNFSSGYSLDMPSKMSIGPDSLIYVTQWGTTQNKVVRFGLDGVFVDEFTSIGVTNGLGHFWDDEGRFYISEYGNGGNGVVRRFGPDGSDLGVFINSSVLQGPTDIWVDANGDVLVEDWTTGQVLRYNDAGDYQGVFTSGMVNPEGHDFLPDGTLLIGDWGLDAVHQLSSTGDLIGLFTDGNGLTDPNAVRVRPLVGAGVREEQVIAGVLQVVPNVGWDRFQITSPTSTGRITVIDATGRIVDALMLRSNGAGGGTAVWSPASGCAEGMYQIVLIGNNATSRASVELLR